MRCDIFNDKAFRESKWLFFDVGSTIMNEQAAYEHRMRDIANQSLGTKERLEEKGILEYIDLVIASAEEGVAKPDRRIFEIALERSSCEPVHAVMIGDRIDNDIVPAKLAGMYTIWIKQGFGQYWHITREMEKPDFAVNSLMELCDILFKKVKFHCNYSLHQK